ncbi:MAG: sialate O-acetylesterase [candidate division WOR-3 bacterium]
MKKFFSFYFIFFLSITIYGEIKLPKLISDGMVLQRDIELKIWGWAKKGEKISIVFLDSIYNTTTNDSGKWEISLPKLIAGGPHEMKITDSKDTLFIKDILIGDVWVASGQSNMELPMRRVSHIYKSEIASSENSFIRFFKVPEKYNFNKPEEDLKGGKWTKTNPETVLEFSSVAYFFSRELYEKYKIPIGIINASLGGSPAEAWMSEDALKDQFPHYYEEALRFKDSSLINKIKKEDRERIQNWYKELREKDMGYKESEKWYNPKFEASKWPEIKIPGYWANQLGPVNGVLWFRREVNIPKFMAGQPAELILGRIIDADSTFVNGVFVGNTTYQYPPRRYKLPEGLLKEGKNIIVIRVISERGIGGFVPDKPYEISYNNKKIDLKGKWKYQLGAKMEPLLPETFISWKPVGLFNGMIAPLLKYRIKGVIWYQGESNTDRPIEYRELFPALIKNWREKWQEGDFPFLFVQLSNFMEAKKEPSESNWALLREAQLKALSLPNTGMAVTIDIGEWNDIHPLNKKDVGKRLSLLAQKIAYGEENVVSSGPIYKSMEIKDNKIILSFKEVGSGLMAKGNKELKHFAIAGHNKKFVWAKAKIEKDKVIVWNKNVKNPIAVRYAWADNPEEANLYNKEGLPASPFRTDDWE